MFYIFHSREVKFTSNSLTRLSVFEGETNGRKYDNHQLIRNLPAFPFKITNMLNMYTCMWIGKSFSVIAVLKRSEDFVFLFFVLLKRQVLFSDFQTC